MTASPRTSSVPLYETESGNDFTVSTCAVTSSPTVPLPRVAARTNAPFSYVRHTVSPSNLYSTVYVGATFSSAPAFSARVTNAASSSSVTALSSEYRRRMCVCCENAAIGSPPTLRVGESGYTSPESASSAFNSSYNLSYSPSGTLGQSST